MAISITGSILLGSFNFNQSLKFSPIFGLLKLIIPSCSSDKFNSISEHIIPKLSTPRILPTEIFLPKPGIKVPGNATTTPIPFFTLFAPHTIVLVSFPNNTLQTLSLSALGCFST